MILKQPSGLQALDSLSPDLTVKDNLQVGQATNMDDFPENFMNTGVAILGEILRYQVPFVTPPFQRDYEWTKKEQQELWDDFILVIRREQKLLFLGNIVTENRNGRQNLIIDGQQRLTSTMILLVALRNRLREDGFHAQADEIENLYLFLPADADKPQRSKLELNHADREYFTSRILPFQTDAQRNERASRKTDLPPSNQNLFECLDFMHKRINHELNNRKSPTTLDKLAENIIRILELSVLVVLETILDEKYTHQVFWRLNERGKNLAKADMVKNYCIGSIPPGEQEEVIRLWHQFSENMSPDKVLSFMTMHWNYTHQTARQPVDLYHLIVGAYDTPVKIRTYMRQLAKFTRNYNDLMDPTAPRWSRYSPGEQLIIEEALTFILLMSRGRPNMQLMLKALEKAPQNLPEFLQMQYIFTFRYMKVCNLPDTGIFHLYLEAHRYLDANPGTPVQEIFDRFFAESYPDDDTFTQHFSVYRKGDFMQRPILARLNDYEENVPPLTTIKKKEAESVEHILSQKYKGQKADRIAGFPDGTTQYVERLANLLLLTKKTNQEARDFEFPDKRAVYKKQENHLALSDFVLDQSQWTAGLIDQRQRLMADVAIETWRYPVN